ncbi:MAG: type II toxin-antitoxin system VapC family toxin [Pirellulales bacterium]
MRILIDTNCYSEVDGGDADAIGRIESATEVWVPLIVLAELYSGFELGTHKERNERQLHAFLSRPNVGVLLPNDETARHYGKIFQSLRRQGTPIPTNDIWIAALALQHDLVLDTSDKHFLYVPQLAILRRNT